MTRKESFMANVPTGQVAVSTSSTTIFTNYDTGLGAAAQVALRNLGPVTVYLGSSVTSGYPLAPGESLVIGLVGDSLSVSGITATGSTTVAYMRGWV